MALSILLFILGRLLGVTELFGLGAAGLGIVLLGWLSVRTSRLQVAVTARVTPGVIAVGDEAFLELEVENLGPAAAPPRRLLLLPTKGEGPVVEVPPLVPGERSSVSLRLSTERRGRLEVSGFDAVLVDLLGTAERRLAGVGASKYAVRPVTERLGSALPAGLETRWGTATSSSGFSHLRPYVVGDDLRRVHWPTSARTGELIVREGTEREAAPSRGVTVVLVSHCPPSAGEAAFELAVTAVASIIEAAAEEGNFRLVVRGSRDTGEAYGVRHLDESLEALVDARPVGADPGGPPLVAYGARDRAVVIVAALADEESVAYEFGGISDELQNSHHPVVVVLTDCDESGVRSEGSITTVCLGGGETLRDLWAGGSRTLRTA